MKTMAVRMSEDVSDMLTMIAQLEETSVAELIREAIASLIETRIAGGKLSAKADEVMAQIDREASDRRKAIEALVAGAKEGTTPSLTLQPPPATPRGRGRARKPTDG